MTRHREREVDDAPRLPLRHDSGRWIGRSLLFVTCVLAVNALVGERGLAETLRARGEFQTAAAALAALQAQNAGLRDEIHFLRHDPRTIEDLARGELGLVRPGEVLFLLKDRSDRP